MRLPHRDANPQEHRRDRATLTHGANPGQATGTRPSPTQPLTKPHRAAGQAGLALHRFALPARETCAGTRKQARVVCFAAPSLCDPKQARACGASTRSLLVPCERLGRDERGARLLGERGSDTRVAPESRAGRRQRLRSGRLRVRLAQSVGLELVGPLRRRPCQPRQPSSSTEGPAASLPLSCRVRVSIFSFTGAGGSSAHAPDEGRPIARLGGWWRARRARAGRRPVRALRDSAWGRRVGEAVVDGGCGRQALAVRPESGP